MSFWSIMNWVAWILCAIFGGLITIDFIKVEREMAKSRKN